MTIFTYLFFGILALISTMLDISYFSFLSIAGSSILITFIISILLASFELRYYSVIFATFAILFYAGLSSVPIYYLLVLFVIIPILVFYARKRVLFELNYFSFLLIIIGSTAIFEIILLIFGLGFSTNAFISAGMFIILNSLTGIILFSVSKKVALQLKFVKN